MSVIRAFGGQIEERRLRRYPRHTGKDRVKNRQASLGNQQGLPLSTRYGATGPFAGKALFAVAKALSNRALDFAYLRRLPATILPILECRRRYTNHSAFASIRTLLPAGQLDGVSIRTR